MAYNYGIIFKLDKNKVRYRYTDKKKSTKTLVYASSKKPVKRTRGDSARFSTTKKR